MYWDALAWNWEGTGMHGNGDTVGWHWETLVWNWLFWDVLECHWDILGLAGVMLGCTWNYWDMLSSHWDA